MSASVSCTCSPKTSFKNPENMRVLQRNCNYSFFASPKGGHHYSDYSTLVCIGQGGNCKMNRRSKDLRIANIPTFTGKKELSQ